MKGTSKGVTSTAPGRQVGSWSLATLGLLLGWAEILAIITNVTNQGEEGAKPSTLWPSSRYFTDMNMLQTEAQGPLRHKDW